MLLHELILLLVMAFEAVRAAGPTLCTPGAAIFLRGQDLLTNSAGRLVLAVFMPLRCQHCESQLKKLSAMSESLHDVRLIVVAPRDENINFISEFQRQYPRLIIDMESKENPIYDRHQVQIHDQVLFDRCGRVAQVIKHPKSDVSNYHDTLNALKAAVNYAHCGPCPTKSTSSNGRSGSPVTANVNFNAYILPSTNQRSNLETQIPSPPLNRQPAPARQPTQPQRGYQEQSRHRPQPPAPQQPRPSYNEPEYSRQNNQQQTPNQPTLGRNPPKTRLQAAERGQFGMNEVPPTSYPPSNGKQTFQEEPAKFNGGDEDYDVVELMIHGGENATPAPRPIRLPSFMRSRTNFSTFQQQEQIPATKAADPSWPTTTPFDFSVANPDIPCTAYTDEICLKQQKKNGLEAMPKCCHKGIYFTDLCVPGKCSNATQTACCLQKFIQARYRCCTDPEQGNGTSSSDVFGKCCFEHFTAMDECCTKTLATEHWQSGIYDICLPNVRIDLSTVRMGDESTTIFDLGEDRSWDFECKYGLQRYQFPHWPWTR